MNKKEMFKIHISSDGIIGHVKLNVTTAPRTGSNGCNTLFGLMYTDAGLDTDCLDPGNTRRACKVLNRETNGPQCTVRCHCAFHPCYVNILARKTERTNENTVKVSEIVTAAVQSFV